jgi:hypothetical protein
MVIFSPLITRSTLSLLCWLFVFFSAKTRSGGQDLFIHEISRSHIATHHIRYDSSGRVIDSSQGLLPYDTQR